MLPTCVKPGIGLFFPLLIMLSSSTELTVDRNIPKALSCTWWCPRCEDSSFMFKTLTEKMRWVHLSVIASINNLQMSSYSQLTASTTLHETFFFFFPLNQPIFQLDHFLNLSLHRPLKELCQHNWSSNAGCWNGIPVKYSPSNHSLGGQVTQSSITESSQVYSTFKRKKKKNISSKDHTNEIYDKFLSESQSREPSLRFWCLNFLPASWQLPKKTEKRQLLSQIFLPLRSASAHKSSSS